jgi:c-di-GMP-binding flagellar brake protein YcgR
MVERRKFQRVRLTAKCMLSHHDDIYRGQLENISLNGALVRFERAVIVPVGQYDLTVYLEGDDTPLQLIVKIVCATNLLTGIRFVSCEADSETRLSQLVEKLTLGPDTQGIGQRAYGNS